MCYAGGGASQNLEIWFTYFFERPPSWNRNFNHPNWCFSREAVTNYNISYQCNSIYTSFYDNSVTYQKTNINTEKNLLGHSRRKQASVRLSGPRFCWRQLSPPNWATGFVQVRVLVWNPFPHVAEQAPHAVHCVYPALTTSEKLWLVYLQKNFKIIIGIDPNETIRRK